MLSYDPYGPASAFFAKCDQSPQMRAVCSCASGAGKSPTTKAYPRTALLQKRTALCVKTSRKFVFKLVI